MAVRRSRKKDPRRVGRDTGRSPISRPQTLGLRAPRALAGIVLLLVPVCACDAKRSGGDPIDECADYAEQMGACFGGKAAARITHAFSNPPKDPGARAALASRCGQQAARLKRACR